MFISLINRQTRKPNDVNTDHIVSIWSADDHTGVWEVTRCRDVNGIEYEMPIPKRLIFKKNWRKKLNFLIASFILLS